jgi:hypothetical protein
MSDVMRKLIGRDTFLGRLVLFFVVFYASLAVALVLLTALSHVVDIPGELFAVLLPVPFFIIWFGFVRRPTRWL